MPFIAGVSPLILLTLNANVDLAFEDLEELKALPVMEPFLANFSQIAEGALGSDLDTLVGDRLDLSAIDDNNSPGAKQFKNAVEMVHAILDLLEAASEDGDI